VYEGRGWDSVGAHVYGHNSQSIGIAFIGDFRNRIPNTASLDAAKQLISCGVSEVNLTEPAISFCDMTCRGLADSHEYQ